MNTFLKLFVIVAIAIIFVLSAVTVYRFSSGGFDGAAGNQQTPPISKSDLSNFQQELTPGGRDESIQSGGVTISASSLLNEGQTFEDPQNTGNFVLAGDLHYCVDGKCFNNSVSDNFSVWFDADDSVFYIQLLKAPIETARHDAERFLINLLNIDPQKLCELNYYMSVLSNVNSEFSGQHLKFSFCSGAQNL
jgi:hypothetical protein